MLKIKDNVNLKELKKFGFKNTSMDIWIKYTDNSNEKYKTGILINPTNKKIQNQIVHYVDNYKESQIIEEGYIDLTSELDILYDLITAGLVKKE